jgi:uncharacterized protein YodC (DUF2158 family)
MQEFNDGQTVRLKSGGPVMTVRFFEHDAYQCVWFDGKGNRVESEFDGPALMEVAGAVLPATMARRVADLEGRVKRLEGQ